LTLYESVVITGEARP